MRTLISQLTSQELGRVVENCDMYGITLDIESFCLELQNCLEHLRTSSEVFEKLRICLCRLRKSWYSPVKNLKPSTQKKLSGIENVIVITGWLD